MFSWPLAYSISFSLFITCMNPDISWWRTCDLFFISLTSAGVESAHWPFWIGLIKRFRNSFTEPSRFSLMKFTMQWSRINMKNIVRQPQRDIKQMNKQVIFHIMEMKRWLHSVRLFWSGVPVNMILLRVCRARMAFEMLESAFLRTWPSSHTTRSGPNIQTPNSGFKIILENIYIYLFLVFDDG